MSKHIVEGGRIAQLRANTAGPNDGTQDSGFVSLAGAHMCYVVVTTREGDNANYTLTIRETDGTTPQNMQNTVQLWHNDDVTAVTDTMTRQANAVSLVVTGSTDNKQTVFAIDPARLSAGYHSVALRVDTTPGNVDGSNQIIGAVAIIMPARYKAAR